MRNLTLSLVAFALATPFFPSLRAASVVVPSQSESAGGLGGSGTFSGGLRLQEVYHASHFPQGTLTIHELRWRPNASLAQAFSANVADLQINLSSSSVAYPGLSSTFAANVGTDDTQVFRGAITLSSAFSGPAGGPKAFDIVVPLTTPFVYNPANGNLLVDIRNHSGSTVPAVDGFASSSDNSGRAFAGGANSTTATTVDTGVDVIQIVFTSTNTPPPPAAVVTRGPYLQSASLNSLIIRWRTDEAVASRVSFGPTPDNLTWYVEDLSPSTEHSLTLTNLSPDSTYYYAVESGTNRLAGGPNHFFNTPPVLAKSARIWAIGDAGTASVGSTAPALVRDSYAAFTGTNRTDVWLMLGDNAYYSGTDSEYQAAVFNVFQDLLRTTPLWPTIGNHETYAPGPGGGIAYFDIFSLPQNGQAGGVPSGTERYYSFDHGAIHFVCLDSELSDRSPGGPMLTWLEQDLAANTRDWTIAYWHSPPYSKGSHDSDFEGNLVQMRESVVPVLESYGVDLVLCGHSHSYERSYLLNGHYGLSGTLTPEMKVDGGSGRTDETGAYSKPPGGSGEGTVYVVAGSSGQTSGGSLNHPAMFVSLSRLGSMVIDVESNRLDAKFLRETGAVDDHFTILKADLPAFITSQPTDQSAFEGGTAIFAVTASGSPRLHYQWFFGVTPIPDATNQVLALANIQFAQAGAYSVVVSNAFGVAASDSAMLTVNPPPPPGDFYDLADGFSPTNNPNGPWTYGWMSSLGGAFTPLTATRLSPANNGVLIPSWQYSFGEAPVVYKNNTTNTATSDSGAGTFPPGTVWFYAGANGTVLNYCAIRFIVPAGGAGNFEVGTAVRSFLDGSISGDTDFHVLRNGMELFGQFLPGNGAANYTNVVSLAEGDTIDFAIGRGADGNQYASGLKIAATLSRTTNAPPPPPPPADSYDLAAGFSPASNPNGPWTYGWMSTLGGVFSPLTATRLSPANNGVLIPSWQYSFGEAPVVYKNNSTGTATSDGGAGNFPPGTVWFYAGANGTTLNFCTIRFTVPVGGVGNYEVGTVVRCFLDGPISGDTDFHVLHNGVELFGQFLPGNGAASYTNIVSLAEGDTIDFAVGRGADGNQYASGLKIAATLDRTTNAPPPPPPPQNLVFNGSFEFGVTNLGNGVTVFAPNSDAITGWLVETGSIDYSGTHWPAGEGNRCLDLNGTEPGAISQVVSSLAVGATYRLSFLMAGNPELIPPLPVVKSLRASIGTASQEYSFDTTGHTITNLGWVERSLEFTATDATMTLRFVSLTENSGGPTLDNISIVLLTNAPPPPPADSYDLVAGFSPANNPNGPWTYGWMSTLGGVFSPLTATRLSPANNGVLIPSWQYGFGEAPVVYKNNTASTATSDGGAGTFPPGTVWFYAGANGTALNFCTIRFTVPTGGAGNYEVGTAVRSFLDGPISGDTDFHVLRNGVELFGQFLPGNGAASYTNVVSLAEGDNVDFAIGRGADGNQYASGLKIAATLSRQDTNPVPAMILVQPQSQEVVAGKDLLLSVAASGTAPLSYRWSKGSMLLPAETNSTLALLDIKKIDEGDYSVVVSNAFGVATSVVATVTVVPGPSILRIVSGSSTDGELVLPVELVANGNENALSFSLDFDPALFSFVEVVLGNDALDGSLVLNTSQLAAGRVGFALALPAGTTFAEGVREVMRISFTLTSPTQNVATPIVFGDQPILRQVANPEAVALGALYVDGTVSIDVSGFESDISPRPSGDGVLSITDWVQVGRFVAGLDTITNELEYQKIDCAPRSSRGDGSISVSDWVQAGRYAASLDPVTAVSGPSAPTAPAPLGARGQFQSASARSLTLATTNALPDSSVSVPIWLDAQGNENAMAFSLSFDSAKLHLTSVTKLPAAASATLNVNTNEAGAGAVGIALAFPAGTTSHSGLQQVLLLNFAVAPGATGSAPLAFADEPVLKEVAGSGANSLQCAYNNGVIVFGPPPPARPSLGATRSSGSIVLFWPASAQGYELYSSSSVTGGAWTKAQVAPIEIGGLMIVPLQTTNQQQYFRLAKP